MIAPWLSGNLQIPIGGDLPTDALVFHRTNDISVRRDSSGWVPNTLSDLTKRENRFAHYFDRNGNLGFPFSLSQDALRSLSYDPSNSLSVTAPPAATLGPLRPFGVRFDNPIASINREGEDVILNDVLAWDIRVFDPEALLMEANGSGVVVGPGDLGWSHLAGSNAANQIVGQGDYVNLDYWDQYLLRWRAATGNTGNPSVRPPASLFSEPIAPRSQLATFGYAVYDTWSTHYESDGLDQDDTVNNDNVSDGDATTGNIDEGTDGFDNNNINGTDDVGERETSPPYDVKLPAVKIIMRAYERDSRQIRETSVTQSF